MNETAFIPSELSTALEFQKRWIEFAYQQPVSDDGKATRAERDEAIVLKKEKRSTFVGLWDAALDVRMKDIQASLDAPEPKEE
ncbi:hypothetical protein EC957_002662 [Mortierella hygrophila]|uniref:Uncharacterized protein n=1 Tax=Mortierella hygrophila TaxID=979708 RepID=A0A9P6F4K7_9FUNG|nr:hypothetical protein EC957_002662 [Mortierella hygrophila]